MTPRLQITNGRVTDVDQTARCPDCGEHVYDEWAFCPFCGVAL